MLKSHYGNKKFILVNPGYLVSLKKNLVVKVLEKIVLRIVKLKKSIFDVSTFEDNEIFRCSFFDSVNFRQNNGFHQKDFQQKDFISH